MTYPKTIDELRLWLHREKTRKKTEGEIKWDIIF